ncbi:MAG: GNAT family N-acetyltransferase [Firmicutes bacterium]|nr:GNAT family N-acetyltransferase [Bacillota bacterium]
MQIITVTDEQDLAAAFGVRREVFVQEQQVPEALELDELDHAQDTLHFVAHDASGVAIGAARLRPYHSTDTGKVERVAVRAPWRGQGVGKALMLYLEAQAQLRGFRQLALYAQTHAQGFYEQLDYQAYGDVFEEAGIAHIAMKKSL